MDGTLIQRAAKMVSDGTSQTVYTMVTHPGHHAAKDSFGGYCYVNHVAALAKLIQRQKGEETKVAIVDVDYHAGNGTASILYNDPSVLVVSIHCDPNYDYPFHSGYADETGSGKGQGATLHVPLPPGTQWNGYQEALTKAMKAVNAFGPEVLLVSLGLDTHDQDPVSVKRAGFCLQGNDYLSLGTRLAELAPSNVPVVFLQEGGYRMDTVAHAAADVLTAFSQHRTG